VRLAWLTNIPLTPTLYGAPRTSGRGPKKPGRSPIEGLSFLLNEKSLDDNVIGRSPGGKERQQFRVNGAHHGNIS
jgi:hypothetical protein